MPSPLWRLQYPGLLRSRHRRWDWGHRDRLPSAGIHHQWRHPLGRKFMAARHCSTHQHAHPSKWALWGFVKSGPTAPCQAAPSSKCLLTPCAAHGQTSFHGPQHGRARQRAECRQPQRQQHVLPSTATSTPAAAATALPEAVALAGADTQEWAQPANRLHAVYAFGHPARLLMPGLTWIPSTLPKSPSNIQYYVASILSVFASPWRFAQPLQELGRPNTTHAALAIPSTCVSENS